ncbi:DMT family transporter [Gymnodinialimonas ceratoperidinii]|uniref:DMT family transporter n=1 Tax=Gymnodinialimonas ceratoperidinii TaxID=2856823 RepID=A0A8F6TSZ7_9RHOB|nr:DMT family transporter [Gymnodinialimonas ceratoperidinii]QXT38397.1 DMT family transporter [Gymnodinialimonas ceratoperidinii]
MTQTSLSTRAWAEMGLLALIWGASFLSIKLGLEELPFLTLVVHRVLWACVILWGYVLLRRQSVPRDLRIWRAFLVMGLLNNAIPFALMAWGQQFIETGLTSIFNAGTAIFGVLVAAIFFADERLTLRKIAGVSVAFFGVTVAIGLDSLRQFDIRSLAQLAVLGGTLSYALASAWARKRLMGLSPAVAAAGMLTGAVVILLPVALIVDGAPAWPALPRTYLAVGYFAVFGTAIAYLLYYRVLAMVGTGNAMLVTLLIPPVAIVLGALVLEERLAPQAFAGFGLLALGLLILDGRLLRWLQGKPGPVTGPQKLP